MKSLIRIFLVFFLAIVFSCETEPVAVTPGNITFRWTEKEISGGRTNDQNDPKSILISINNNQGTSVYALKKLALYKFGQEYVSENLQLMVGTYQLMEFFVLDENDNIIYATPVVGSELAEQVDHPLPFDFEITESGNTELKPQVLPVTDDIEAESFGYVTFGFELVGQSTHSHIKEIWMHDGDELPYRTSYKIFLNYAGDRLVSAATFGQFGSQAEWDPIDSMRFKYNSDGKLSEKVFQSLTLPPHYTTERYTTYTYQYGVSGEVLQVTRSGGLMTAVTIDYNYDQAGHILTAVEHRSFQTLEYEFEVNSDGDVLRQRRFFVGSQGRKLQYNLVFAYDESLRDGSVNALDLLNFDIFLHGVSFGKHNISSHKTASYSEVNGIITETFSCINTAEYTSNTKNQLVSAIYFDANLCTNRAFDDGMTFTFIY